MEEVEDSKESAVSLDTPSAREEEGGVVASVYPADKGVPSLLSK